MYDWKERVELSTQWWKQAPLAYKTTFIITKNRFCNVSFVCRYFRTYDGSCNWVKKGQANIGTAGQPFGRYVKHFTTSLILGL